MRDKRYSSWAWDDVRKRYLVMWIFSVNPAADCKLKPLGNNLPACHILSLVLLCNMLSRIHKQRTWSLRSRLQIKSYFIWIPNLQAFEIKSQHCKPKYSYKRSFYIIPCSIITLLQTNLFPCHFWSVPLLLTG